MCCPLTCTAFSVTFLSSVKPVVISATPSIDKHFTAPSVDIVVITWKVCQTDTRFRLKTTGIGIC